MFTSYLINNKDESEGQLLSRFYTVLLDGSITDVLASNSEPALKQLAQVIPVRDRSSFQVYLEQNKGHSHLLEQARIALSAGADVVVDPVLGGYLDIAEQSINWMLTGQNQVGMPVGFHPQENIPVSQYLVSYTKAIGGNANYIRVALTDEHKMAQLAYIDQQVEWLSRVVQNPTTNTQQRARARILLNLYQGLDEWIDQVGLRVPALPPDVAQPLRQIAAQPIYANEEYTQFVQGIDPDKLDGCNSPCEEEFYKEKEAMIINQYQGTSLTLDSAGDFLAWLESHALALRAIEAMQKTGTQGNSLVRLHPFLVEVRERSDEMRKIHGDDFVDVLVAILDDFDSLTSSEASHAISVQNAIDDLTRARDIAKNSPAFPSQGLEEGLDNWIKNLELYKMTGARSLPDIVSKAITFGRAREEEFS